MYYINKDNISNEPDKKCNLWCCRATYMGNTDPQEYLHKHSSSWQKRQPNKVIQSSRKFKANVTNFHNNDNKKLSTFK